MSYNVCLRQIIITCLPMLYYKQICNVINTKEQKTNADLGAIFNKHTNIHCVNSQKQKDNLGWSSLGEQRTKYNVVSQYGNLTKSIE